MIDEAQIIKRCIRKEKMAQKILFDTYASILLGICRRYVYDQAEAEDVLQEGFLKIYLNLKNFKGSGTLINWMKKIVVNTSITYYHRNYRYRYHSDIDESQESGVYVHDEVECEFTREELLNVVIALPPGYRMVFNLYAIEGYKHKEIAKMLDIDINTSKSQYSRAKKLIRDNLEELSKTKLKNNTML